MVNVLEGFPFPVLQNHLSALAKIGENQFLEFKLKANHPEKIVKEMVAFANADGGLLVLGISDEGEIRGIKSGEEEAYALESALHRYSHPVPDYRFCIIKIGQGREIVVFRIEKGKKKPYYLKEETKETTNQTRFETPGATLRKPYVRYEDKSLQASPEWRKLLTLKEKAQELTLYLGPAEERVIRTFSDVDEQTLREIQKKSKLPFKKVSYILVRLTYCNVLEMKPAEGGDLYKMLSNPMEG